MKTKKEYRVGEKITSLPELLAQEIVYFGADGKEGLLKKRVVISQHPFALWKYIDNGWFKKSEEVKGEDNAQY